MREEFQRYPNVAMQHMIPRQYAAASNVVSTNIGRHISSRRLVYSIHPPIIQAHRHHHSFPLIDNHLGWAAMTNLTKMLMPPPVSITYCFLSWCHLELNVISSSRVDISASRQLALVAPLKYEMIDEIKKFTGY